jgi:hypothetical protein
MKKIIISTLFFQLVVVIFVFSQSQKNNQKMLVHIKNFNPTYVNTVYVWFKNTENKLDKEIFEAPLNFFLAASKYAKTKFISYPPKATRGVVVDSFAYSLVLTFAFEDDQVKYQKEPAHELIVKECKDFWSKVMVFDSLPIK